VLFTPERHEPLTDQHFTEADAREAIERIAARAAAELDPADGRWPLDAEDRESEDEPPASAVYHGAAGIAWALGELADGGYCEPIVDRALVDALEAKIAAEPDPVGYAANGVWFGPAGVLAAAEHRWPDSARRDRLFVLARASLDDPALDIMFGHPGYMALAAQLHVRTGEERWAEVWREGADRLFEEWRQDEALGAWYWLQRFGEREAPYLGAAHGLVGNLNVLLHGEELLSADRRAQVERRAVETLTRLAVVEDGRANWPTGVGKSLVEKGRVRVQWCHGAAGVVATLAKIAPENDEWGELLLAGGRLVWDAGAIRDAAGLCHGTAGNAYALLALWERTRDEEWLERARAFAQHAALQAEDRARRLGRGRHSLFTGDEGVAICLAACLEAVGRFPVAERLV
jgi:lanthionine synthetase-like protein